MDSQELLRKAGIECDICKPIQQIVRYGQQADEFSLYVDVYKDSYDYIEIALKRKALVLSEKKIPGVIWVQDARKTLSDLLQIFYDFPASQMRVIGVTGTCGKSTVAHLISQCLKDQGIDCCLVMTQKVIVKDEVIMTQNTTPDALFLLPLMKRCLQMNVRTVVMEVSSEAYAAHRVDGLYFDVMIGTVVAQDHLNTHQTIENYRFIKKKILSLMKPDGVLILNSDDPWLSRWKDDFHAHVLTYGKQNAAFQIADICCTLEKTSFTWQQFPIVTSLLSQANVYNLAAAMVCAFVLDLNMKQVLQWAHRAKGCEGRFELISRKPYVMVDYAHTERAMEEVLSFVKNSSEKKIICVFGCGGEREVQKRAKMGEIACRYADQIIVTSDNPRSESPEKIIEDILTGCSKEVVVEADRVKAIEFALETWTNSDIIILLGKGDEKSLFSKGRMVMQSDKEVVLRRIEEDV